MANNRIQIKRTSVSGRSANTTAPSNSQYIAAGELAINMPDGILYSSNGSELIVVGANVVNQNITGNLTVKAVIANGSIGSPGQTLASNGSAVYWTTVAGTGTVTQVDTGNGLTGGPITSSGAVSVNANDGIVANSSGLYVKAGDNIVVNSSGVHASAGVNTAEQYTFTNTVSFTQTINGTANNSLYLGGKAEGALNVNSALTTNNTTYLNGQLASYYTNATNITTGSLPYAQIPANIVNTTGSFTFSGVHTYNSNIVLGSSGISANGGFGTAGEVLHSNGSTTYWAADDQGVTSVSGGTGLSGGTITSIGTLSVNAAYIATIAPTLTGGGASGNWGINVTGSAGSVAWSGVTGEPTTVAGYGITNALVRGGAIGNIDYNAQRALESGIYSVGAAPTNGPSGGAYSNFIQMYERGDTAAQLVIDYATGRMYSRGIQTATPTYSAWRTQLDDGNYNSYAPTLTGTGASGNWGINITGYATSVYSPTNAANFYTNNGTYGSWRIDGSRNGWQGIEFAGQTTLMMNDDSYGFHRNGVGWKMYVTAGSLYVPGNITAYWSDRRLKENLRPIGKEASDILSKLTAYRFNWNDRVDEFGVSIKAGKEEIGLIAQEVQEILPDAVEINKAANKVNADGTQVETDYLTINWNKITPLLVQALNDTTRELNDLKKLLKDRGLI
jgi:hypothetical protein